MLKKFYKQNASVALDCSGVLEKKYQKLIADRQIEYDPAQNLVLLQLQGLLAKLALMADYQQKPALQKMLMASPEPCQSLYIFGDVGRGKSMLMGLFFETCPILQKRRVHFSAFMLEVHAFIHQWRQGDAKDAISALAEQIRTSVLLLCFDEFHVTDIADAMILGRLFSKLFESGIVVVITSNRHPSELYQGGLLRDQFLFFINVLQGSARIVELVAKEDYRLSFKPSQTDSYFYPLGEAAEKFIQQRYTDLTGTTVIKPDFMEVFGRKIYLRSVHEGIVLSSFKEICGQALGSADYLTIASRFSVVILEEIPRMTPDKRNEAKRFVTLIDILYEHKIKLICSAEVKAEALYIEGDGAFEFRRTTSRLMEMQSESYWRHEHLPPIA